MKDSPLLIGIIGASGRLGQAIAALALSDPRFSVAAAVAHPQSPHLGADLGSLLNQKPLGLLLSAQIQAEVDLLIDASLPLGLRERLALASEKKIPMVIGTTGLSEADRQLLKEHSRKRPLFYAPNFSIGMALMKKLAAEAARFFPPSAHIDLIETHHSKKKDAPSGSALLLAQTVRESHPGHPLIPIHSLRSGKIIGEHTLLFNTPEERLTLSHEAHSRDAFARGALAAALFLKAQKPGLYGMEDLLK